MRTRIPKLIKGCLFAAGSFAALSGGPGQLQAAEWPMPINTIDLNPTGSTSATNKLLVYSWDDDGVAVPMKTLKITNLHNETVFPVFRDGNEAYVPDKSPKTGLYDPFDPIDTEYRGYVGYRTGTNNYFGLKPGESILVRIPLVFWNGARMGIVTDGKYMVPTGTTANPMRFSTSGSMVVAPAEQDPNDKKLIKNGIVMWYTSTLNAPALDSPDQLTEWTVRDKTYLSGTAINKRTDNKIPASEKVTLINYDVSYVDNMFLPAAMEALDVPIPAPPYPPGRKKQPYGWIGAINTSANLQKKIQKFTADKNEILGDYFGGKGWPIYNIPMKDVKIPAAQNIFAQSPFADVRSSYENEAYMLSSGGTIKDLISVSIGSAGTASSGKIITLSPSPVDAPKLAGIQNGYTIEGIPSGTNPPPVQPGTKIVGGVTKVGTVITATLSKPLVATEAGATFKISRPVTDYASTKLIRLWFSWVLHYTELKKNTPTQTITGAVKFEEPILSFSGSQSGLIPGMQVTGPGLPDPNPSLERGGVIVLEVAQDGRSVLLSQIASANHPIEEGSKYTFKAPQPLTPKVTGRTVFNFSGETPHPARDPDKFAERVYLAMASMNQIEKNTDPKIKTPYVNELMNNVVGGNMGFMFEKGKNLKPGAIIVTVVVRDTIKSILRGVTDFTKFPEYDSKGNRVWYPDPKIGTGFKNSTYNVFNLDPFVRFVHVDLGFSGYGFSLDDDTADVGAGEATKLLMTIGGRPPGKTGPIVGVITAAANPNEWTIQAPYGAVKGKGAWDPKQTKAAYLNIKGASNTQPIVITCPDHGLGNGEKAILSEVGGNTAANGTWNVTNVSKDTFELVGSKGNAPYTSGGKWTRGALPYITLDKTDIDDIYWRIKGDDRVAGFQGAFVSTDAVTPTKLVRVVQLGDDKEGILMLSGTLTIKGTNRALPKGKYNWIFSGTLPAGEGGK